MSTYYFDSSGLVKYYIPEPGSAWVTNVAAAKEADGKWTNIIAISRIGIVEVAAAIAKRRRTGAIEADGQIRTFALFMQSAKNRLTTLPVTDAVLDSAAELTQRHPLRGYDAVHLAAALVLNETLTAAKLPALTFVAADAILLEAARADGLTVHNPNSEEMLL